MPTFSSDPLGSGASNLQRLDATNQAASLEAGLDALEQKRFEEAIAQLEAVYHTTTRQSIRLKAQMGLVKAYESNGQIQQALTLCEPLVQSANTSVREWAEQALQVLQHRTVARERQETAAAGDATPEELAQSPAAQAAPVGPSPTLFQPTSPSASAPGTADPTGFIPLDEVAPSAASETPPPASKSFSESPTSPPAEDITGFQPAEDITGFQIVGADAPAAPVAGEPTPEGKHSDNDFIPTSTAAFEVAGLWEEPIARPSIEQQQQEIPDGAAAQDTGAIAYSSSPTVEDTGINAEDNPFSFDAINENSTVEAASPATTNEDVATPTAESDDDLSGALNIMQPRRGRRKPAPKAAIAPQSSTPLASERAKNWQPLSVTPALDYWISLGWAAIALVVLLKLFLQIALSTINPLWQQLSRVMTPPRLYWVEAHPLASAFFVALGFTLVSPWLLRLMLGRAYGVKPLPPRELERRSPEASRLLQRVCKQQGFAIPPIGLITTQTPVIMSYGLVPRTARIVISQGLLTQLQDDEIAALMAAELGHIRQWSLIPVTAITAISQVPFWVYWRVAEWGDRRRNPLLRGMAGGLAAAAYGLFWLLRWPGLWASRTRQRQGDRQAASITGHPNGLARALCTMTLGMAQDIERQRLTPMLLEGAEMLMPISHRAALPIGTASARLNQIESQNSPLDGLAPLLQWETHNPHRRWLSLNQTHPPLGDRLQNLNQIAQQWRLRADLDLSPRPAVGSKQSSFTLQAAPFIGIPAGLALAMLLWLIGGIAQLANFESVEWMWRDRSLLVGCIAMGYSFGALMRINAFFPDIKTSQTFSEADLPDLLTQPQALPVDSTPIQLRGRLLGRPDLSNGLYQDLFLRTETGSLKLHYLSHIGPLGNLILGKTRLTNLIGRSVVVTGWFRRGATPWIDVESLRTDQGRLLRSGHPFWSTLLALAATLWGAIVIYRGTL